MDRRNCSAGAVLEFHLRAHASDVRDRLTVAAAVAVTTGIARLQCAQPRGGQSGLMPNRYRANHEPHRLRDRAPRSGRELLAEYCADRRSNECDSGSAGLLLLNDRHGPVQGNWTWQGKRHDAPDLL